MPHGGSVALRKESVDRNSNYLHTLTGNLVALRKESVDRNFFLQVFARRLLVALRKESVDRNDKRLQVGGGPGVALRKESVDRNPNGNSGLLLVRKSLSARRAWIEITQAANGNACGGSRSPQGERG